MSPSSRDEHIIWLFYSNYTCVQKSKARVNACAGRCKRSETAKTSRNTKVVATLASDGPTEIASRTRPINRPPSVRDRITAVFRHMINDDCSQPRCAGHVPCHPIDKHCLRKIILTAITIFRLLLLLLSSSSRNGFATFFAVDLTCELSDTPPRALQRRGPFRQPIVNRDANEIISHPTAHRYVLSDTLDRPAARLSPFKSVLTVRRHRESRTRFLVPTFFFLRSSRPDTRTRYNGHRPDRCVGILLYYY